MTPHKNNNPNHKYWLGRKQKLISDMWYHLPVAMGENLTWQNKIRKTWMKNVLELGQHSQYSAEQPQNCGLIPGIGIGFFSGAQPMGERDVLEVKKHEANPSSHLVLWLGINGAVSPHPICLHEMQRDNCTFTFWRTENILLAFAITC